MKNFCFIVFMIFLSVRTFADNVVYDGCSEEALRAGTAIARMNNSLVEQTLPATRIAVSGVKTHGGLQFTYNLVPVDENMQIQIGRYEVVVELSSLGQCEIVKVILN